MYLELSIRRASIKTQVDESRGIYIYLFIYTSNYLSIYLSKDLVSELETTLEDNERYLSISSYIHLYI
jgi:hypothetical protein